MHKMSAKKRILKHMARDKPDTFVVDVDRHDLINLPSNTNAVEKYLGNWIKWMRIKHGEEIGIDIQTYNEFDYDRIKLVGRVKGPWR